MRAYIANTDVNWYRHLSGLAARPGGLDEANFWRPSGKQVVGYLSFGDPFVFKLKKAHGHNVVGFGLWVGFAKLTVQEAWDVFGEANGASSLTDLWGRLARLSSRQRTTSPYRPNHVIGCDLIASPVFFPEDLWIPGPAGWSDNTVTGAGYDIASGEGHRIWQACLDHAARLGPGLPLVGEPTEAGQGTLFATDNAARYGAERTVRPRLGQGTFRFAVQGAYQKCAVTREHSLPALEAAHIVPYAAGGPHDVANGLLLRADLHRLFDRGYVTVTPDYRFRVSPRLATEYHNGKVYYQLEGTELWLPDQPNDRPAREHLERHNDEVFLAS